MTDRTSEIQAALAAVPAPPWRWIGSRTSGGPELVTDHSGRQYLLRATKPTDARGDEILDPVTDYPVYGDLQFRDKRPGERYSTMRRGDELAVGRTHYDEITIVDVDNPVARFLRDAPQYVADLLAENARLRGEVAELQSKLAAVERQAEKLDRSLDEVMKERDDFQDMADKLAYAVAPEEVIGEHSSMNCPWENALDLITPMADVDKLRKENAAYERALGLNEQAA